MEEFCRMDGGKESEKKETKECQELLYFLKGKREVEEWPKKERKTVGR